MRFVVCFEPDETDVRRVSVRNFFDSTFCEVLFSEEGAEKMKTAMKAFDSQYDVSCTEDGGMVIDVGTLPLNQAVTDIMAMLAQFKGRIPLTPLEKIEGPAFGTLHTHPLVGTVPC